MSRIEKMRDGRQRQRRLYLKTLQDNRPFPSADVVFALPDFQVFHTDQSGTTAQSLAFGVESIGSVHT